jgi:glycosidase
LAAATSEVKSGALTLTFDKSSGKLLRISFKNDVIAETGSSAAPISFATGAPGHVRWLEDMGLTRQLVAFRQLSPASVEVTARFGDFELVERYKLHQNSARLDRSATLTYRGTDTTVKLRGLVIRTAGVRAAGDGFYRFPQVWPPASHPFSQMAPGTRPRRGKDTIAPLAAQLGPKRTVLWLTSSDDNPSVSVTEGDKQFDVNQEIQAQGYLRPGVPQEMGFASMLVVEQDYWKALPATQDWLDSTGTKVPRDSAPWTAGAIFYSFHPGGTIGSGWRDLGGFKAAKDRLLPSLDRLGVSSLWILPVEYRSPYWPLDYYRFMDGLGTEQEYRDLISRIHAMGLPVIQDLVPHGGAPIAVHNQQHPEFMLHREDGSTLTYWLNDFARPDWQDYIAKVVAYYMQKYGVDGYRIDAIGGSKEANWDPNVPYARASLSKLWGGLKMLDRIRSTVKEIKPREGAVLAEVQSVRHWQFSDMMFDFSFGRQLCPAWRHEPPAEFVVHLQDSLAEQNLSNPRGANWLRHIESHDLLRSQLWWGVEGMRAMYALSAWIDGVPMIYQGMENGHAFELRRINDIRRSRPELRGPGVDFRAVHCDQPGVFTCLRSAAGRQSVVAINFNYDPVVARLTWPGGAATVKLKPLGYTLVPEPKASEEPASARTAAPSADQFQRIPDGLVFDDASEWFVDTAEGRLHDRFVPLQDPSSKVQGSHENIYWRPQNTATIWQNDMAPLHPAYGSIGVKHGERGWTLIRFEGPAPRNLRLMESHDGKTGLCLVGLEGSRPGISQVAALPAAPDVAKAVSLGGVTFRVVGPDYIVGNRHFTVVLRRQGGVIREFRDAPKAGYVDAIGVRRQGGVIREFRAGAASLVQDQDLYGDQAFMRHLDETIRAANDVECGQTYLPAGQGLHVIFEGQLRAVDRFGIKRPPVWYRTEYVFTDAARFTQKWAFRTEKSFANQPASLAWCVTLPTVEGVGVGKEQRSVPDKITLSRQGTRQLTLEQIQLAAGSSCALDGNRLVLSLLDSPKASLEEGKWYESQADWVLG